MSLNLNLINLSLNALIQRKNAVIEENTQKISNLEHDYLQQINQLNMIKQALLNQYQNNLRDQLKQIDVAIQHKLPKNNANGTNNNTHKLPTTINGVKRMQIIPTPIKMQPLPLPSLDNITSIPTLNSDNSNHSSSSSSASSCSPPITQSPTSISPNSSPSTDNNNSNHNNSYSDIPDFTNLSLPNLTCIISSIDTVNKNKNKSMNIDKKMDNHQHSANGICNNNSSVNINSNTSNIMTHIQPTSDSTTTIKNDIDDKDKVMRDIKDIKDIKMNFNANSNIKPSIDCNLCHKSFDSQKSLKNHINKVHTFTCDLCSKSFQKRIDLKRHQRIHDGVSVYEWYQIPSFVFLFLLCFYT